MGVEIKMGRWRCYFSEEALVDEKSMGTPCWSNVVGRFPEVQRKGHGGMVDLFTVIE